MATVFRLAAGVFFLVFLSFSIASASASPSIRSNVLFCTNEAPGSTIGAGLPIVAPGYGAHGS